MVKDAGEIALLRDVKTEPIHFRSLVGEIAELLFFEASTDLQTTRVTVQTPLAPCPSNVIWQRVGVIPILRAGLGFDRCDVAVVTNIGEGDHLGLSDIGTLEKHARVKRSIVEAREIVEIGFQIDGEGHQRR